MKGKPGAKPAARRIGRRAALVATSGAVVGCVAAPKVAPNLAEPHTAAPEPVHVQQVVAAVEPVAPAVQVVTPAPPPGPTLMDLGVEGIVQPFWAAEGDRVLFYDQPAAGQGGTWRVDPASGRAERERPQWGSYVSRGTLLVTPRPDKRDTYVLHVPSGREWAVATTNGGTFSPDGTMLTYAAAAPTQGAFGGPGNFTTTTLMVSWADGQEAKRLPLPISASAVAWIRGADGSENGRLLLTGRRSRQDTTSFWLLDPNNARALNELSETKTRRLVGTAVSPDGDWAAYYAMWNQDPALNGLWVMRTDGSARRKLDFLGSYRWSADNRLITIPMRAGVGDSHEVWEVVPATGEVRRLTDGSQLPIRVSNYDWDLSPDGTSVVFVEAGTRRLSLLTLPAGMEAQTGVTPAAPPGAAPASGGKPYRLPFQTGAGPGGWYIAQWYGVTTNGYRGRNSVYSQGQGIHFGIDFAAPLNTPLVAVAPGRVIAIDGDYGSPPHNVVVQLDDGNIAMYGHVIERSRHVEVGQRVQPGDVVANTGDSSAPYDGFGNPHVHLEIRKAGRAVATNLVPWFGVNWDDLSLGAYPGPRFERDLDTPRRNQFPEEQPDMRFGGPIITNFARPWPV